MPLRKPLVVAIPRGGIEVGAPLATCLGAELDIALAARTQDADGTAAPLSVARARELEGLDRARTIYRAIRPPAQVEGRSVILTDDGAVTGLSLLGAARSILAHRPHELIVALPCARSGSMDAISALCSRTICLRTFSRAGRMSRCYRAFPKVPESRVIALLSDFARTA